MKGDDSIDLDPSLLADPVDDDDSGEASGPQSSEGDRPASRAIVPAGTRQLAPFDPFRRYMAEIGKYPPLDPLEERELARRYRDTGDREALFRLITANLRLVVHIALSFRRAAKNLLDLIQEGNVGLLQAIERFDPEVGVRLPTYAAYWIRAYMVKFLLDNVRLVRVGTTNARRKLLRNLRQERERLQARGIEVGPRMLAEHFGVSEADVRDVEMALESRDVSIDAPVGDDESRTTAEVLPAPGQEDVHEQVERREIQERVEAVLAEIRDTLNERDRALLDDRILSDEPQTLQQIGERFGTTREAVRQAEVRLMKRLKELFEDRLGDLGDIRIGPS